MTPRTTTRIRPIPFAVPTTMAPAASPAPVKPSAACAPMAWGLALGPGVTPGMAPRRPAPAPIAWGAAEPAVVMGHGAHAATTATNTAAHATAEDPRALYNVTRRWQGQATTADDEDDAGAAAPASAQARARATANIGANVSANINPHGELMARYTGQGSLCVRSSVTGRHYRFQGHGDMLRVDKHDMMLLKRIADLQLG